MLEARRPAAQAHEAAGRVTLSIARGSRCARPLRRRPRCRCRRVDGGESGL